MSSKVNLATQIVDYFLYLIQLEIIAKWFGLNVYEMRSIMKKMILSLTLLLSGASQIHGAGALLSLCYSLKNTENSAIAKFKQDHAFSFAIEKGDFKTVKDMITTDPSVANKSLLTFSLEHDSLFSVLEDHEDHKDMVTELIITLERTATETTPLVYVAERVDFEYCTGFTKEYDIKKTFDYLVEHANAASLQAIVAQPISFAKLSHTPDQFQKLFNRLDDDSKRIIANDSTVFQTIYNDVSWVKKFRPFCNEENQIKLHQKFPPTLKYRPGSRKKAQQYLQSQAKNPKILKHFNFLLTKDGEKVVKLDQHVRQDLEELLEESRMKCNAINVLLFFDKKIINTKGIAHDKLRKQSSQLCSLSADSEKTSNQ